MAIDMNRQALRAAHSDRIYTNEADERDCHHSAYHSLRETAARKRKCQPYVETRETIMTQETNSRELKLEEIEVVAGGNAIQVAMQAYQSWMTCLKSCADSKGQVQAQLARFS